MANHLGGFKSRATVTAATNLRGDNERHSGHLDRLRGEGVVRRREAVVEVFFFFGVSARFHLFSPPRTYFIFFGLLVSPCLQVYTTCNAPLRSFPLIQGRVLSPRHTHRARVAPGHSMSATNSHHPARLSQSMPIYDGPDTLCAHGTQHQSL